MSTVSVVIPTYNSASTVVRAVQSALEQTYPVTEIIVVDDGSTDETRAALAPFKKQICYISQENMGRSAARNRGISAATGKYIAFLDADDWWLPQKIEKQVEMLKANPKAGMVYTARFIVEPDGRVQRQVRAPKKDDPGSPMFKEFVLHQEAAGSPSFVMIPSEVLDDVGVFETAYDGSEDWELWLRIAAKYPVAAIGEPLVYYQLHSGSQLQRILARNVPADWYRVVEDLFAREDVHAKFGHLRGAARARVLLWDALLTCGTSLSGSVAEKLHEAEQLDSDLFCSPCEELERWIIHLARLVGEEKGAVNASLSFVDQFWHSLPSSCELKVRRKCRAIKGKLSAGQFFEAASRNDWLTVRSSAWTTIQLQPHWLKNIGFVSLWIRSWLQSLRGGRTSAFTGLDLLC